MHAANGLEGVPAFGNVFVIIGENTELIQINRNRNTNGHPGRYAVDALFDFDLSGAAWGMTVMREARRSSPLEPGERAPDFQLFSTPNQQVGLSDFRGKPLILAFYPADWSPVCTDQMALYQEVLPEFKRFDASLLGISVDGVWCHLAFAKDRNLKFPLLADFEPKGEMSRAYGVYRDSDGTSERALYVIDPGGLVHWSYVSPTGVNPGADGILRALNSMTSEAVSV